MKRPLLIALVIAVAVIVTGAALLISGVMGADRESRYIDAVRSSGAMSNVPDAQLLYSMRADCERLAEGWDESDRLEDATPETRENVRVLWRAAVEVCG